MNGQKVKSKETEKAAVFFEHGKVLEEAISRNQYLLMKQEIRQEGILVELAKYRRAVLQKEQKAARRNKSGQKDKKDMSGQFTLFEEKAS